MLGKNRIIWKSFMKSCLNHAYNENNFELNIWMIMNNNLCFTLANQTFNIHQMMNEVLILVGINFLTGFSRILCVKIFCGNRFLKTLQTIGDKYNFSAKFL